MTCVQSRGVTVHVQGEREAIVPDAENGWAAIEVSNGRMVLPAIAHRKMERATPAENGGGDPATLPGEGTWHDRTGCGRRLRAIHNFCRIIPRAF